MRWIAAAAPRERQPSVQGTGLPRADVSRAEIPARRPGRDRASTASSLRALLAVALLSASALLPRAAHAQTPGCERCTDVGEAPDALPGIADVPVAVLRPAVGGAIVASGAIGISIGEPWEDATRHRLSGSFAGAIHAAPWLAIGLRVQGRWDEVDLGQGAGGDSGLTGFPTLTVRATVEPAEGLGLALDASVWMQGVDAPSLEPGATSLRARGVGSYRFSIHDARLTLTAAVGGLLDNSRAAAPRALTDRLSDEDRLSLGISDFSGVTAGLGVIVRTGILEVFGEASYLALLGAGAPDAGESPLHVVAGARLRPIGELLELGVYADLLATSANARFVSAGQPAAPIDPRFTIMLAVGVRLGWDGDAPVDRDETDEGTTGGRPIDDDAPLATTSRVEGRVTDPAGAPVESATVEVVPSAPGAEPLRTSSDADGRWAVDDVPAGPATVIVRSEGREPFETTIDVRSGEPTEVATAFAAELPQGEIRGTIQGSNGRPLAGAEIRIRPSGIVLATDEDGAFEAEVPPGTYEVEVRAAGHRAQTRRVEVIERGVVLLNAQLHRGR